MKTPKIITRSSSLKGYSFEYTGEGQEVMNLDIAVQFHRSLLDLYF